VKREAAILDRHVAAHSREARDGRNRGGRLVGNLASRHAAAERRFALLHDHGGAGDAGEPREFRVNGLGQQGVARRVRADHIGVGDERFETFRDQRQRRQPGCLRRRCHDRWRMRRQQLVDVMFVVSHAEAARQPLTRRPHVGSLIRFVRAIESVWRWNLELIGEKIFDLVTRRVVHALIPRMFWKAASSSLQVLLQQQRSKDNPGAVGCQAEIDAQDARSDRFTRAVPVESPR
jgi:hypothetical protein